MARPAAILSILVEANTGKASKELKVFNAKLDKLANKKVVSTVKVDVKGLPQLTEATKRMTAFGQRKSTGVAKIDVKGMADLSAAEKRVTAFGMRKATAETKVKTEGTVKAGAEIDKVARDRKTEIKVDTDRSFLFRAIQSFRALRNSMDETDRSAGLLTQGMMALKGASGGGGGSSWADHAALSFKQWAFILIGTLPIIIDLTAALGALAASAGAAAAGVGALAVGGAGAGSVGLAGIVSIAAPAISSLKTLITAMDAMHQGQATGARTAGRAQQSAAQAIKSANQGIVTANRAVQSSEQTLSDAQKASKVAQQDLNLARQQATRDLQDMKRAADEAGLSEARSRIGLQQAQQNLIQLEVSGTASALDLKDAELGVQEARAAVKDATIQGNRAQSDYQKAQQKGVNKMPGVVQAQRALNDATENVTKAQQGVKVATEGVQQAIQNLALQQSRANTATTAGVTQMAALQYQMRKAGPEAVKFAKELMQLKRHWLALTQPGRDTFFKLLQDGLDRINHMLPMLAKSANTSMRALRVGFGAFLKQAMGPEFKTFIHVMTDTFAKATPLLGDAFGRIAKILERIAVAAAPEVIHMINAFDHMIQGWDKNTQNAGKLAKTIHMLVGNTWAWIHLIEAAAKLIVAIFIPGINQGKKAVEGVTAQLHEWTDWVKGHPKEMRDFFKQGLETTKELFAVIIPFIHQLFVMGQAMRPIATGILDISKALLKIHIGPVNALLLILVSLLALKFARWTIGIANDFGLLAPAATKAMGGLNLALEDEGGKAASSFAGGIAKALPFAIAAIGVANIISSVVSGDLQGSLFKAGGAAAGALAGGLIGGLPGALVGLGIGSILGGLLSDSFEGAFKKIHIKHISDLIKPLEKKMKQNDKAFKAASKGLADSNDRLSAAHKRVTRTTDKAHEAAKRYLDLVKQYGPNSRQAAHGLKKLTDATDAQKRAEKDAGKQARIHGAAEIAYRTVAKGTLVTQDKAIQQYRAQIAVISKRLKQDKEQAGHHQKQQKDSEAFNKINAKLTKTLQDQGHKVQDVQIKLGKKAANTLTEEAKKSAHLQNNLTNLNKQDFNKLAKRIDGAGHNFSDLKVSADGVVHKFGDVQTAANFLSNHGLKVTATSVKDVGNQMGMAVRGNIPAYHQQLDITTTKTKNLGIQTDTTSTQVLNKTGQIKNKGGSDIKSFSGAYSTGIDLVSSITNKALAALGIKKKVDFSVKTQKKRKGGSIVGGSGSGDKVPAMLEPGEIVWNRDAVKAAGKGLMAWNNMNPRKYAKGGKVDSPYRYPIGPGVTLGRVDMGVDYGGTGPIGAIGSGQAKVMNPFSASGFGTPTTGLVYKMDAGAPKGFGHTSDSIYIYEGFNRKVGSGRVKAGEVLGNVGIPGDTSIEMGFAVSGFSGTPLGAFHAGAEPHHTVEGENFAAFLRALQGGKGVMGGSGGGGPSWKDIKRVMFVGPSGEMRQVGQATLDQVVKAANTYGRKHAPKGMGGGALPGARVGNVPKSLPPSLKRYDRTYPSAVYPSAAWSNLPKMPFNKVAELAEWAGKGVVPGVTMADVSLGEGDLRPGSESTDGGYGMWGYTPSASGIVLGHSGKAAHNPIVDAEIMAAMYRAGPGRVPPSNAIWHGYDPKYPAHAHYQGKMMKQGGLVQGLQQGGMVQGMKHGGKARKIALIGDSLADNINHLYGGFPANWEVDAKSGRHSAQGIGPLKSHRGGAGAIVWELGTNDTPSTANAGLKKLPGLIGNRGLALMTTYGQKGASTTNKYIRADKRKNALADWQHQVSHHKSWVAGDHMGIHPNAAGAHVMRSQLIRAGEKALKFAGPDGPSGAQRRQQRRHNRRHHRNAAFARHLSAREKGIKALGVSPKLKSRIDDLTQHITLYADFADRAEQSGGSVGPPSPPGSKTFDIHDEAYWLNLELTAQLQLRNALLAAERQARQAEAKAKHIAAQAEKRLKHLQGLLQQRTHIAGEIQKKINANPSLQSDMTLLAAELHKDPKDRDQKKIAKYNRALRKSGIKGLQDKLTALKPKAIVDRDIKATATIRMAANQKAKNLKGALAPDGALEGTLITLQGASASHKIMKKIPELRGNLSLFGGDILATQLALRDLNAPTDSGTDNSNLVDLLKQQVINLENFISTFSAQKDVFSGFPQFAKGGIVPGPVGAPLPAIVHGGETITPAGKGTGVRVEVHDHRTRVFIDEKEVRAIVKDETRQRRGPRAGGRGY